MILNQWHVPATSPPRMPNKSRSRVQRPPQLLWFDLTRQGGGPSCIEQLAAHCQISLADPGAGLAILDGKPQPDMLCLHYDHPDSRGLDLLLEIKRRAPGLPITMLTVQHSEELAVWAFRAGVWEYLVLPLTPAERQRYLQSLHDLQRLRAAPPAGAHRPRPLRAPQLPECVRLSRTGATRQPLHPALTHIEGHFRERIDERDMARLCGMSSTRFSRLFKQSCGIDFQDYLTQKRMQAAEEMLLNSSIPISSIGYLLGFKDPSCFARAFRRHFGCSPTDCRSHGRPPGGTRT